MRRLLTLAFLVATISAGYGVGVAKAQDLPPSLEGEVLFADKDITLDLEHRIGEIDAEASCNGFVGETFTIAYTAEGPAFGPYPGTFTESGTATATLTTPAPPSIVFGVVINWTANFTIDSAVGQVTGTKTFTETTTASCVNFSFTDVVVDAQVAEALLRYEATIQTAEGTFTDQGDASGLVVRECYRTTPAACDVRDRAVLAESFVLSRGVLPLDTTGKATGGGQIGEITSARQVTFGFEVKKTEEPNRLQGRCLVNDPGEETRVKCLTVTDYQQVGNSATWEGIAEVNGAQEHYRITVQDNGEPNQGLDIFSIETESYQAAGNVEHGNIQIH